MKKIVILDKKTLGDDINIDCIYSLGEVKEYKTTSKEQTLKRVKDADIVITNKVVIDKNIMEKSNIKLICVAATGMNNIDLESAKLLGIDVKNVENYSTNSVVQVTFSMALYLIGRLKYYDNYTKQDGWINSEIFTDLSKPFFEINGKKWGIIGLGNIGKNVAKVASSFGADVIYYSSSDVDRDTSYKRVELDFLLKNSDVISIHAPLNKKTRNLINRKNLFFLKSGAVLLNLGRGGIINELDLSEFMDNNHIFVGLDVLENEPMKVDNPLRNVKAKDRILITPHIAWASVEARKKLIEGICKNIKDYLGGNR